jgi:protein O-GlcNAc transferase
MSLSALYAQALHLYRINDSAGAQKIYEDILKTQPDNPQVQNTAGLLCAAMENFSQAIVHFEQALRLDDNCTEAYCNLGNACNAQGDFNAAIIAYKQAIKRNRKFFEPYYNLGNCLRQTHNFDEAITCYKAALHVRPASEEALISLGEAQQTMGNVIEAQRCYHKIVELSQGKNAPGFSNLLLCMNYNPAYSPERLYEEHAAFGRTFSLNTPSVTRVVILKQRKKIRIGYVSPDFCMHPVSRFIEPVLRFHDKDKFEIFCYSDTSKPDEITAKIKGYCTSWKDISPLSDFHAAELIKKDDIDILVDLSGHTAHNRLLVFARKPAPVQVSYLGYPNTTGLHEMDYYLSDAVIDPEEHDRFFSEKLVRLEKCFCTFLPYDNSPQVNESPALKTGSILFGSLHTLARLNSPVIELWSKLLKAVPLSRLCIVRNTLVGNVRERLYREFECHGIPRERIDMRNALPPEGHLALYHDIDISLDTFPWSGHTTACESLWMGVAVITLLGNRHAGRMVSSILYAAGYGDFIARSESEYISIAMRLASSIEKLAHVRRTLRGAARASDLCDGKGFTQRLESALSEMCMKSWERGRASP